MNWHWPRLKINTQITICLCFMILKTLSHFVHKCYSFKLKSMLIFEVAYFRFVFFFWKFCLTFFPCEKSLTALCWYILCLFISIWNIIVIHFDCHCCVRLFVKLELCIICVMTFLCYCIEDLNCIHFILEIGFTSRWLFRFICCVEHAFEYLMILMWFRFFFLYLLLSSNENVSIPIAPNSHPNQYNNNKYI